MNETQQWKRIATNIFWGEIAPCDHVIQFYENDDIFLDTLAGFVGGGINAGECVIVIATPNHLQSLYFRLSGYAINIQTLMDDERYIPLNAEEVLGTFMVDGWPDEDLFNKTISSIVNRGIYKNRRVRAFGEMVALLWGRGDNAATVHLEHLWNRFCEANDLSLFCAYPKTGFTEDLKDSIKTLCACHSKIISGKEKQLTEVHYLDMKE